ncbi:MAG: hypothetical protein RLZZ546_1009 [Bacteroidota bacterium]|jgi:Leucine-rich repeat (LRR) protein
MKNTYLVIALMLISYFVSAQIINIPDPNFKNAFVNTKCVDADENTYGDIDVDVNNDGEIDVSEAEAVIDLFISKQEITNLSGIEYFKNLDELTIQDNNIEEINIADLLLLQELNLSNNKIKKLNLSNLPNLKYLDVMSNKLTSSIFPNVKTILGLSCGDRKLYPLTPLISVIH